MTDGNMGMLPIRIILEIYQYAMEHPELQLLVTPVGCGTARYTLEEMGLCSRMLLSWGMYICLSASERCRWENWEYNIVSKNIDKEV